MPISLSPSHGRRLIVTQHQHDILAGPVFARGRVANGRARHGAMHDRTFVSDTKRLRKNGPFAQEMRRDGRVIRPLRNRDPSLAARLGGRGIRFSLPLGA
jgi:hypothetical protein